MKILVVDDEIKIANTLAERLRLRGLETSTAYTGESALSLLGKETFDAMVLDLRLPDLDGIDVLKRTMNAFPNIRVAILSGHGTDADFKACLEIGAIACFQKPANIKNLTEALTDLRYQGEDKNPANHRAV